MSESLAAQIVPQHLGIILDGNRRWANARGLATTEGHKEGFKTVQKIADVALARGIKHLTVYAFSTENWSRSKEEVTFLMKFTKQVIKNEIKGMHKKNVRFLWLGSEDKLDESMLDLFKDGEALTKSNTAGTFCFCFNYGGQTEIAEAANKAAQKGTVTVDAIEHHLYGAGVPPIDLLIRTSGEHRISNFMLWRSAYSELFFSDVLWPDYSTDDLDEALAHYASRKRRFGK
jgi:undecaprenyl diphosphate synthase